MVNYPKHRRTLARAAVVTALALGAMALSSAVAEAVPPQPLPTDDPLLPFVPDPGLPAPDDGGMPQMDPGTLLQDAMLAGTLLNDANQLMPLLTNSPLLNPPPAPDPGD